MPDIVSLKVTGMEEAIRGLQQLSGDWKVFAVLKGLNMAGDIMRDAVDYYTPIRLDADSEIALGWSGHGPGGGGGLKEAVRKQKPVVNSDGSGGFVIVDHNKLGYVAYFLEYGHRMIGHKPELKELKGPRTPGGVVKPYPIYRRAVAASAQAAVDAFSYAMLEAVKRNLGTEGVAA